MHRQKVIGSYIVDFYIASVKIAIELDGSQHYGAEGKIADEARDAYLKSLGLTVLRYSNADVNFRFQAVCEDIWNRLTKPSPQGEALLQFRRMEMQIENHKEEVPFAHYEERFRSLDPAEATARTNAKWDGKEFYVNLLGREFAIYHPDYGIRAMDDGVSPPLPVQTFLLRYLLESKSARWAGEWRTFREMPWGEMYIKPYTGRVLTRAAFTFGTRLNAFKAASEKMGALPVQHGDAGYEFNLIGGYRMRILVWEGDDEFPPNAQVLYSDNFAEGFAAEDRVVAGDILISTIKANM